MDRIVILGYGGHGKSVADSIISQGKYKIVGYTDIEDKQQDNITYLGSDNKLEEIFARGVSNAVLGIGFMGKSLIRNKLYEKAKHIGFHFPSIIDPAASIAINAVIKEGAFVGKRAVVNAGAIVGKMCIINTGAIIEHECVVGDFTHVAVGAVMCGQAEIGENAFIGANATVLQGVKICSGSMIGASSIVRKDVNKMAGIIGNNQILWGIEPT